MGRTLDLLPFFYLNTVPSVWFVNHVLLCGCRYLKFVICVCV